MSEYLNNRELATIIWFIIAIILLLTSSKIREPAKSILSQLFVLKFNIVYILMTGYVTLMLILLSKLNIWDINQTKLTIIWFAASATPNIFKVNSFKDGKSSFKGLVLASFKVVTVLNLIISTYIFGIFAELFLIPLITILSILIAYCEVNPEKIEYNPAYKFLNTAINIIVLFILSHAIYSFFINPDYVLTKQTIFDFLLPILLTTMFIPFLYCLMVYSIYETVFIRVNRFIKERSLNKKIKFRTILLFNFRTKLLERWQQYALSKNITSYGEIESSFKEILRLNQNEKKDNKVSIKDGWSPSVAKRFLIEKNLKVGYYNPPQHPEYDKSWFACSNMLEIDDGLPSNNISYHIEGYEGIVKSLKLFMNINNKEKVTDAHDKLLKIASLLCKKAVDLNLSNNIKNSLLDKGDTYKEDHENFAIAVEKNEWETGNGYSVSFTIQNQISDSICR